MQTNTASEYYVQAPNGASCPDHTETICHDLSFYTNQTGQYFTDNTVLYFLEGTHSLQENYFLVISGVKNLTLSGLGAMEQGFDETLMHSTIKIHCLNSVGGMAFFNITNLTISTLTFYECGSPIYNDDILYETVHNYTLTGFWGLLYARGAKHTLFFANIMGLKVYQLSVLNSTGRAVSAVNAFDVDMSYTFLTHNNIQTHDLNCTRENHSCSGGNIFFLYIDPYDCWQLEEEFFTLSVTHSTFSYGVSMVSSYLNGGLGVGMYHSASYGIDMYIDSVILTGNTGYRGANLHISIVNTVLYHTVTVKNVSSRFGNSIYQFRTDLDDSYITANITQGAGLYYNTAIFLIQTCANSSIVRINNKTLGVTNSLFANNLARNGGGAWLSPRSCLESSCFMKIEDTTFRENVGVIGSALIVWQFTTLKPEAQLYIILNNAIIENNEQALLDVEDDDITRSAFHILLVDNMTMAGVTIKNHSTTGIHLFNSDVTINSGNTTISNNTSAENGGGLSITGNSHLIMLPTSNLIFSHNRALYGGALYVQKSSAEDDIPLCFFQVDDPGSVDDFSLPDTYIYSYNNSAVVAGDILYSSSGALFDCILVTLSLYQYENRLTAFKTLLRYDDDIDDKRAFSSKPVKACFCVDNDINCTITTKQIRVTPGQNFNISAVTVGLFESITPGVINVRYIGDGSEINNEVYETDIECANTTYQLLLAKHNDDMHVVIKAADSTIESDNRPLVITLDIQSCPPGFELKNETGVCECNSQLMESDLNITCDVQSWMINRDGNNWISYNLKDQCTVTYVECPFDYCNELYVSFNISEPDPQCALNRSGILCGQCAGGLSLMLGSNKCGDCSNIYISLIIPFALAGIALVAFIIALNLTVSVGTINGLIFYANIVKINESVFFQNQFIPVLSQFISWINLDLGIQTCFFSGLDAYYKTWLQFIFPIWIWTIVVLIIVLSRWYKWVAYLAGDNAVPVLATLFLLSYTKVLRTVIQAWQIGYVSCSNETVSKSNVWLVDGTISYLGTKHSILFVFSLLVFIFIAVPYTLIHLFIPVLETHLFRYQRFTNLHMKVKPYFDAFCGPYKDEYRFWGGFLLLARLILALIIPFRPTDVDTSSILGTVMVIIVFAWNLRGVYQKRYLDILESWFLLNLGFLSISSLRNKRRVIGVTASVSFAFITFIFIVIFHLGKRVYKFYKRKNEKKSERSPDGDGEENEHRQEAEGTENNGMSLKFKTLTYNATQSTITFLASRKQNRDKKEKRKTSQAFMEELEDDEEVNVRARRETMLMDSVFDITEIHKTN